VTLAGQDRSDRRASRRQHHQGHLEDGRVLMSSDLAAYGDPRRRPGRFERNELSWLDYSLVTDISSDGRRDSHHRGRRGRRSRIFRHTCERPMDPQAVRISGGARRPCLADGRMGSSIFIPPPTPTLVPFPTAWRDPSFPKGRPPLTRRLVPDGKRILLTATEPGRGTRLYVRDFAAAARPRPHAGGISALPRAVSRRTGSLSPCAARPKDLPLPARRRRAARAVPDWRGTITGRFDREGRSLYIYRLGTFL
jgi:hypothetical protein